MGRRIATPLKRINDWLLGIGAFEAAIVGLSANTMELQKAVDLAPQQQRLGVVAMVTGYVVLCG